MRLIGLALTLAQLAVEAHRAEGLVASALGHMQR